MITSNCRSNAGIERRPDIVRQGHVHGKAVNLGQAWDSRGIASISIGPVQLWWFLTFYTLARVKNHLSLERRNSSGFWARTQPCHPAPQTTQFRLNVDYASSSPNLSLLLSPPPPCLLMAAVAISIRPSSLCRRFCDLFLSWELAFLGSLWEESEAREKDVFLRGYNTDCFHRLSLGPNTLELPRNQLHWSVESCLK